MSITWIEQEEGKKNGLPERPQSAGREGPAESGEAPEAEPLRQRSATGAACGQKEAAAEDVVRRLCQIAFSSPNDAIALACGRRWGCIEEMDLAAVAEFKCKDETAEVKFVDRVRALQLLWELLGGDSTREAAAARDFLLALEGGAQNIDEMR